MLNRPAPDYEKEFTAQLQRNDKEVIDLLGRNDPGMLKKIHTFSVRHNFSLEDVIQKVKKDFIWKFCDKEFYASHKYTRGRSGGSQGGAYKDLQEFLSEANQCTNRNQFFVAISDGEFYRGKDASSGSNRIEHLNNLANRLNVFAMPIEKLEGWLNSLCKKI